MKTIVKRSLLAACAAALLCPSLAGCGKKEEETPKAKLFDEPVTFSIMTFEHPSQQVNPNALKYQAIKEATNVTLDFDITPNAEYNTKKAAAMGAGVLSDITYVSLDDMSKFAKAGIFMDVTDRLQSDVPNFYNRVSNDVNWKKTGVDGRYYGFAILNGGTENLNYGGYLPVIRYDILEKNNLKLPTTFDEWFVVMKQLKTIYPNSTPFSGRNKGHNMLTQMSYAMGCAPGLFYDYEQKQYTFGFLDAQYKEILQFFAKCYEEGILDHNWMTVDANTWDEGVSNGNIFFWYDNGGFASSQTKSLQKSDPKAKMQVMPLMKNSEGKKQGLLYNQNWYANAWALSANTAEPDKLLKFMNWLYSDEGMYICNYGKEGESFNLTDDGKVTIPQEIVEKYRGATAPEYNWMSDYGLGLLSFTPLVNTSYAMNVQLGLVDTEFNSIIEKDFKDGSYQYEAIAVPIPEDSRKTVNTELSAINGLIYSGVRDFVEGTRPMTEYDNWVTDMKNAGAEHVLQVYNDANKAFQ